MTKDDKAFKAYRNVLSAASPFFCKLFQSDMKENREGIVRFEEISSVVMEDVLEFICTGSVEITQENSRNLIAAANYLLRPTYSSRNVSQNKTLVPQDSNSGKNKNLISLRIVIHLNQRAKQVCSEREKLPDKFSVAEKQQNVVKLVKVGFTHLSIEKGSIFRMEHLQRQIESNLNEDSNHEATASTLVQSLNSPFFASPLGAEPGRAKREFRTTCMRMRRTN